MVLAVVAGLLTLVVPRLRAPAQLELRGQADDVAAGLRRSREHAVANNVETLFVMDVAARAFAAPGVGAVRLAPDVELVFYTSAAERIAARTAAIRFYPDGTTTGGRIRLVREGQGFDVLVDWLTARVRVETVVGGGI